MGTLRTPNAAVERIRAHSPLRSACHAFASVCPPGFALFGDDPQRTGYTWGQQTSFPSSPTKFFRGFLSGAIVSAILAAILFFAYGDLIKALQIQLSARIGASPAPPAAPAARPPAAVTPPFVPSGLPLSGNVGATAAPTPLPLSADDSKGNGAAARAATEPPIVDDHVPRATGGLPPKGAEPGAGDLALAHRYLSEKPGPTGSAAATRSLWAAVEKGNVQAEITLADLYARGDGVTKSCDQAQVLLRAAARKGSSKASQELAQIIRRGCH
jgi:TPR repeat protein